MHRCKGVGGRHAETGSRGSVCLGRSCHRFIRRGKADEVIDAIAKTVAGMTSQQGGVIRQQLIEHLTRGIMHHDGEFRREEATSAVSSHAKHFAGKRRLPQSALTRSTSPGRGDLRSQLSREALTSARVDWGKASIRPHPMLDRPGGHLGVQGDCSLARKTAAPVQLICPCVVGRKDLMTKFYPAAVGDTRTRVRQSLRREDGAGIIGGASRRH